MSAKKLFSPEDFDKPSETKRHTVRYTVIATAFAAALVLSFIVYSSLDRSENVVTTEVVEVTEVTDDSVAMPTSQLQQAEATDTVSLTDSIQGALTETPEVPLSPSDEWAYVGRLPWEVIRGNYGNNPDRKRLLGDRYELVQKKVNELIRSGKY